MLSKDFEYFEAIFTICRELSECESLSDGLRKKLFNFPSSSASDRDQYYSSFLSIFNSLVSEAKDNFALKSQMSLALCFLRLNNQMGYDSELINEETFQLAESLFKSRQKLSSKLLNDFSLLVVNSKGQFDEYLSEKKFKGMDRTAQWEMFLKSLSSEPEFGSLHKLVRPERFVG